MLRDLRYSLRLYLQSKGWTAVVLLSLALGIGVTTTLFTAVNGLMLETILVSRPDELARLQRVGRNQMAESTSEYGFNEPNEAGERRSATFSYAIFEELSKANQTLSGMFACAPARRVNLIVNGQAELSSALLSTGGYFDTLGVPAFLGRTLGVEDDAPDAPAVAMISFGAWQGRFGLDPDIVGKSVTINNIPVTIVGVTPESYNGIQRLGGSAADLHLPLHLDRQLGGGDRLDRGTYWWLQIVGRLRPEVGLKQVEGNLGGVFQEAAKAGWDTHYAGLNDEQRSRERNQNRVAVPRFEVRSASRGVYDTSPRSTDPIVILSAVVVLVLLIVCANVANLLLSRATSRQKEISIRLAVGATRGRLIAQLLSESVLLAVMGGALAMLVAYWSRPLLPLSQTFPLDWKVFAFATAISALTGIAFGIIPALRATRIDLAGSMKETGRSLTRSRGLLGKSLLVVQVAVSLVLLIGAGLFLQTLENLRNVDVGFETENLLLVSVSPRVNNYDEARTSRVVQDLEEGFAAIPGVRSVSLSQTALLSGSTWSTTIHIEGVELGEGADVHEMHVSGEFFETLGIDVLSGRAFTDRDIQEAPEVVIINEALAREYFADGNPLGRRLGTSPEEAGQMEIVGVVSNTKYSAIRDDPPPTIYRSYLQTSARSAVFGLRTALAPRSVVAAVRETAHRIDPNLPLGNISTQAEEVEEQVADERVFAMAYALFGGLALLLASIGLFGLMSYSVAARTNEIGIRMALGAGQRGVLGLVIRESLLLVVIGAVVGLGIALAAGRLVSTLLYDLAPTDPLTMVAATVLMFLVAGFASYLPARRASRVDPLVALRYE